MRHALGSPSVSDRWPFEGGSLGMAAAGDDGRDSAAHWRRVTSTPASLCSRRRLSTTPIAGGVLQTGSRPLSPPATGASSFGQRPVMQPLPGPVQRTRVMPTFAGIDPAEHGVPATIDLVRPANDDPSRHGLTKPGPRAGSRVTSRSQDRAGSRSAVTATHFPGVPRNCSGSREELVGGCAVVSVAGVWIRGTHRCERRRACQGWGP
jgi:hypothetical protein